jgi:hypothetical protein
MVILIAIASKSGIDNRYRPPTAVQDHTIDVIRKENTTHVIT